MEINNQQISDKTLKGLAALVILLAAVYVFGFLTPASAPVAPLISDSVIKLPATTNEAAPASAPAVASAEVSKYLADLQAAFPKALNEFLPAPAEPQIARVWLVAKDYSYVEFIRGKTTARALVMTDPSTALGFKVMGYFIPGGSGWILEQGTDKLFKNAPETLYEYDAASHNWVPKD